jgi:16S rRNA (cytosine967-C5)-methyltransferase
MRPCRGRSRRRRDLRAQAREGRSPLDWTQPADVLARKVRAFDPWPIAEGEIAGERVRIHGAIASIAHRCRTRQPAARGPRRHRHRLRRRRLRIRVLQRAGGKPITAADYLNARRDLRQRMNAAPGVALRVLGGAIAGCGAAPRSFAQGRTRARLPALATARSRLLEAIVFTALRQRAATKRRSRRGRRKPLGRRDAPLRALLHAGFAQSMRCLPAHAASDATVEAARDSAARTRPAWSTRCCAARCATACRRRSRAAWPSGLRKRVRATGRRTRCDRSPPVRRRRRCGCASIARACRASYRDLLAPRGIEAIAPAFADASCCRCGPVHDLPASTQAWSRCRTAARKPSPMRCRRAGAHVLDACAAPGGKSAHLLERDPSLRLLALDIDAHACAACDDTHARLGASAARPARRRCRRPRGLVGRHALRRRAASMHRARPPASCAASPTCCCIAANPTSPPVRHAGALLDACWRRSRPAACCVRDLFDPARGERVQVDAFLARTPGAACEPCRHASVAQTAPAASACRRAGMDGFFYARCARRDAGDAGLR